MHTENRFNLIDEPWIPIADVGLVSLKQLFSNLEYRALGGNPVQKIALTKLLLAIAQAAYTPVDDDDWGELGASGMAEKCLVYLERWHDRFYLYGEKPFLQMPAISSAAIQSFGAVLPQISTGNTTVLLQTHVERNLDDAERALLVVALIGFALGGKKTDNSVVLSMGYNGKRNDKGKPGTAKPGASVGFMGFMHNFLMAESLSETLWLNLLTKAQIDSLAIYSEQLGVAPWEAMPTGENCSVAQSLQKSMMGRFLPLSRFCLLTRSGLHYSEGIAHLGYKEGMADTSVALNLSGKEIKAMWIDPERRPWRQLTALLGFMKAGNAGFDCFQVRANLDRACSKVRSVGIWSGGLRVSSNAGEQYVSGTDDFVESSVLFEAAWLNEAWYDRLSLEMTALEIVAKTIYGATLAFYKEQTKDGKDQAAAASNLFWQLCERQFQNLVDSCGNGEENTAKRLALGKTFAAFACKAYDSFCPQDTARQLDAWAKSRPNFSKYIANQ